MKNTILNKINNNPLTFEELFASINTEQQITKQELSYELKNLSIEKIIVEFDKKLIKIDNYSKKIGFVHWSINNLAWIEPEDNTNSFGVSHNYQDKENIINNKKEAELGSKVEYIELFSNEKKYSHIINKISTKNIQLILSKKHRGSQILNTNFNFDTPFEFPIEYEMNDIVIATKDSNNINIVKKIGNIKDKGIESLIVSELLELKLPPPISISSNINTHKLLNIPFLTVDSATTKDVDDAIYIEPNNDGFTIFVAIADVDHYIKQNTEADLHAQNTGTTFYLTQNKIPMFDSKLSENLASLNLNEVRPAFICKMHLDNNFEIKNYEFFTDNIKVQSKISYDDINNLLNNLSPTESFFVNEQNLIEKLTKDNIPNKTKDLINTFELVSNKLKKIEQKKEYWFVKNPDFHLNEHGKISHLFIQNDNDNPAQTIVETSMLAANISAAEFLRSKYPYIGIFRNQINLDSTQKPKSALYHNENNGHWGLQEEAYTHFTSPIRRYCDLVAHRLIKASINNELAPYSLDEVKDITDISNTQQYIAKQANIKEKTLLSNQYLETLIKNKELSNKYNIIDYNQSGILIRNKQLIDVFVPYFKIDREIQNYLNNNLIDTPEKQTHLDYVNHNWQIKCFIDRYDWIYDKKEFQLKFYKKENNNDITIKI